MQALPNSWNIQIDRFRAAGYGVLPAAFGRRALTPYEFWRQFLEIENVVAVKIAPFNRYQTIDVVRALSESGRVRR
jgi:hypothetical protein